MFLQLFCIPVSNAPEIDQRPVFPQLAAIAHLVQLGDPHAVLIGRTMLGLNIHCDLGKIQVRADARCCRNAGRIEHIPQHFCGKLADRKMTCSQIIGGVDEYFINGVDMDIFGRDVLQVNVVNSRAVLDIERHSWTGGDIIQCKMR